MLSDDFGGGQISLGATALAPLPSGAVARDLVRYLDEQPYRFNNRRTDDGARFVGVMGSVTGKRVTYEKLTAKNETAAPT